MGPQSIHVYLSAIRAMHITQGLDCPPPTNNPHITLAMKGLRSSGPPPKQKITLTLNTPRLPVVVWKWL